MPLDAAGTTVLPVDSPERWSHNPNAVTQPRDGFTPTDDNFALYITGIGLQYGWAKRLNDGHNHCIVGWVVNYCEPLTTFNLNQLSEQSQHVLRRLHDALPRSAKSPFTNAHAHAYALARYNDTHSHKTMISLCRRAYKMYINEIYHGPFAQHIAVAVRYQSHLFTPTGRRRAAARRQQCPAS